MLRLIDYLLGIVLKSVTNIFGIENSSESSAMTRVRHQSGNQPRHHTIPIYLCGPKDYTYAAPIDFSTHSKLHTQMYLFSEAFNIAGKAVTVSFEKRKRRRPGTKPGSNATATQKLGRTIWGRTAIVAGLNLFYANGNYMNIRTGGKYPYFNMYFLKEERRFIPSKRAGGKNSYPSCSR